MKELELITLYFYLCECNDTYLWAHHQRFSPNFTPSNQKITDTELLTIYFYCRVYENKHLQSDIYDFANRFMKSWFPNLPAYANFNSRLNAFASSLSYLVEFMLNKIQKQEYQDINFDISLVDSLPIMLCSGKRKAKVAPELATKSYCSTKGVYYHGLKLHTICFQRKGKLPIPEYLLLTTASEHDLDAVRQYFFKLKDRDFFADKAYINKELTEWMNIENKSFVHTPVKLVKGENDQIRNANKASDDLFSRAVSAIRQPVESFFSWLIRKANIQDASTVRSTKGLLLHTYGAIATALFHWLF